MSGLTQSQLQRIEDNRRKALQKKALRLASSCVQPADVKRQQQQQQQAPKCAVLHRLHITGYCRLVADSRFVVDVAYHQRLIDLLKTIKSAKYDASQCRWTFLVHDHKRVMSCISDLRAEVSIMPLPRLVLEVCSRPASVSSNADSSLCKIESTLLDSLMPFQKEGVCFGISKGGRCLIADDMGLGKTIQALGIAHYYVDEWPMLIVCPSSMRFLWAEAIQRWLPSIPLHHVVIVVSGKDIIDRDVQVLITSYDLLSRLATDLFSRKFGVVVLDESHLLKSISTARTKAATGMAVRARRTLLLSGTPALSRPVELFTQLRAIDPKAFRGASSYQDFGLRYCAGKQTSWGWDFTGSSNTQELQLLLERHFMIRRLKADVIAQLPAKRRQVIMLDIQLAKSAVEDIKHFEEELQTLKASQRRRTLLQYFQASSKAKLRAIKDYVTDLVESNKKFICFAHHHVVMNGICDVMVQKKIKYICINGNTTSSMRKTLCDQFQYDDTCKVAVLSLLAASSGITLTAAHLVVFAELFWNPGVLIQAEDRAHRIGQQDSVLVQYLVGKGTADDHLWPLVQNKLVVLNEVGLGNGSFQCVKMHKASNQDTHDIQQYFSCLADDSNAMLAEAADLLESQ